MVKQRRHLHRVYEVVALLLVLTTTSACVLKKCQQSPTEAFQTFVDQEWRIVESNDPQFRNLTNVNFTIVLFSISFDGGLYRVENNKKYENPAASFYYNVDPGRKLIRLQYFTPPTEEEIQAAGDEELEGTPVGNVVTYKYKLGREFTITDQSNGFFYRMVPFQGVVRPDEKCTF